MGLAGTSTLTIKMAQNPSKGRVLFDVLAKDYSMVRWTFKMRWLTLLLRQTVQGHQEPRYDIVHMTHTSHFPVCMCIII
jgi:hypothetical protein